MCLEWGAEPKVSLMMRCPVLLLVAQALLAAFDFTPRPAAAAHNQHLASWPDVKCSRYRKAWSQAIAKTGTAGLGREFLVRHEAFLASNCTIAAHVCPRSDEEFRLANLMVVLAMNAGTASTFPPFACPQ